MSDEAKITYPPELLPSPDEGEDAEVLVVDPVTGAAKPVWRSASGKFDGSDDNWFSNLPSPPGKP